MTANNLITIEYEVYNSLLEELEQLRKIADDNRYELNFQYWNSLLEGVLSVTNSLIGTTSLDDSVSNALARLGKVFNSDRVYVVQTHSRLEDNNLSISQTLRWYSTDIPVKSTVQNFCSQDFLELCYGKFSKYAESNLDYRSSLSGCTKDFPENECKVLEAQCVLSIAVIPIIVKQKFWGFIGFDRCYEEKEFSSREVSLLIEFADSLAGIIAKHQDQAILRESQQNLSSIIDNIPQRLYWKDKDSIYQGCNLNGAKFANLDSPTEIVGKGEYDIPWGGNRTDEYGRFDLEVVNQKQPLSYIADNLYINKIPLQDKFGSMLGILMTVEDISQLQQMQSFKSKCQEDLRILFDSVYDAIFVCNLNGDIIDVNRRALQIYGVNFEEATKLSFVDDYSSSDNNLEELNKIWQNAIAGKGSLFEWKAKKPFTDEIFDVEIFLSKINLNAEDVVLASVRDITKRKQAETELQQLNDNLESRVEVRTLQLIQSESRLRNLANSTPGVIYEFCRTSSGSMKLLYVSSGCEEILGLTSQALQDNTELFFATIHPEDLSGFYDSMETSAQELSLWEFEWRSTTVGFQQKWLKGISRPQSLVNGDIVWYGYVFDITRSKEIESELQRSQQLLQLVIDNIPQSIFWKDCDNLYLGCNSKFALDAGVDSPEDIVGKTDYQLSWSEEKAQIYRKYDRDVMMADSPRMHNIEIHEQVDGRKLWLDISRIPLHDEKGSVVGLLGCIEDISERKEIEASLKESEVKFRSIVETANDIIYILNSHKEVSYVSPNWNDTLGHENMEAIGQPFAAFIHHDDLSIFLDAFSKLTSCHRVNGVEHRLMHQDETYRWYTSNFAAVRDEDDNILYFTAIARDITERREAEILLKQQKFQLQEALQKLQLVQAQLIQSEKMSSLGQIVAGVAHEINNPISFIYSNLLPAGEYIQNLFDVIELYEKHYPHPVQDIQEKIATIELDFLKEDLLKILFSMETGTERIRNIVLSLRNFSRLDESEFKRVDIHKGIDSTLLILCNALKKQGQEIEVILDYTSLPLIDCCPGELNQVFMSIITNAIDALNSDIQHPSPQIHISTILKDNGWIKIAIADNGSGIPKEIQSKLFDPFFTTKQVGKGTGLGLFISYQIIVEKHHGKLYCESIKGEGTKFILEIPIKQKKF